jgi:hypothetical protein
LLLGAKVRCREYLLKTEHLNALFRGFLDELHLVIDVRLFDLLDRAIRSADVMSLYQPAFDYS